jgi:hypothetical protein
MLQIVAGTSNSIGSLKQSRQHDEWAVVRRYMSAESLAKARLEVIEGEGEEMRSELVAAS